jgi:hypothetical protein
MSNFFLTEWERIILLVPYLKLSTAIFSNKIKSSSSSKDAVTDPKDKGKSRVSSMLHTYKKDLQ